MSNSQTLNSLGYFLFRAELGYNVGRLMVFTEPEFCLAFISSKIGKRFLEDLFLYIILLVPSGYDRWRVSYKRETKQQSEC